MPELIEPRAGWLHFGCMECGNVECLPASREEDAPWCTHGGAARYVWGGPSDPSNEYGWTPMVRVRVEALEPVAPLSWLRGVLGAHANDVLVFGSGVMLLHGLRERIGDVDLFVKPSTYRWLRMAGWEELRPREGDPAFLEWAAGPLPVHAFVGWTYRDRWLDVDEAWRRSHVFDGWRCVDLDLLLEWKRNAERDHPGSERHAKHGRDAAIIERHLADGGVAAAMRRAAGA